MFTAPFFYFTMNDYMKLGAAIVLYGAACVSITLLLTWLRVRLSRSYRAKFARLR